MRVRFDALPTRGVVEVQLRRHGLNLDRLYVGADLQPDVAAERLADGHFNVLLYNGLESRSGDLEFVNAGHEVRKGEETVRSADGFGCNVARHAGEIHFRTGHHSARSVSDGTTDCGVHALSPDEDWDKQ